MFPLPAARDILALNYSINATLTRETGSEDIWIYCCFIKYTLGFQVTFLRSESESESESHSESDL